MRGVESLIGLGPLSQIRIAQQARLGAKISKFADKKTFINTYTRSLS
jgi:hypothetical protein